MRKQLAYILIVFAAIVGCFVFLFRGKKSSEQQNVGNLAKESRTGTVPANGMEQTSPVDARSQTVLSSEAKEERKVALIAAFAAYSQQTPQPIVFYGKVVDQNMQPVASANISFNYNQFRPEGSFSASATSDNNGIFSLSGVSGVTLSVKVSKDGYDPVTSSNQYQFVYLAPPGSEPFHPDAMNPVIFYLRKMGNGVNLITSQRGMSPDFVISPPIDGRLIKVDLLKRKTGGSGQLEIQNWLDIDPNSGRTKSWRLKLFIPDGGFIETQDEFPFLAPEKGYQSELDFPMPDANGNIRFGVSHKLYYVAFGNPRCYGRLEVSASDQTGEVMLQYAINPDGSRNLEPK